MPGLIKRVFNRLIGKSSSGFSALVPTDLGPVRIPRDYRALSIQGYSQNPYVYRAIKMLSQAVGSIPWVLFREKSDGSRVEVPTHPLLDLINQPNEMMGRTEFMEFIIGYIYINGNAPIVWIGTGVDGDVPPPKELWPLRPDQTQLVTVRSDGTGPVVGYDFRKGTPDAKFYPKDRVLLLKTFNPLDARVGLSPLAVTMASVLQGNEARKWNIALLKNSARPAGAFTTGGEFESEEAFKRSRDEISEKYGGVQNAGKPLILEGGLKWDATSLKPGEMEWLGGQSLAAREIAITIGVAPELLGDAENKTYSNFKEARKALYEENAVPTTFWIRDEFNNSITPLFGDDLMLDLDLDSVPALQDDRESLFTRAQDSNFLTVDEKRRMTGYDDYDPTDEPGGQILVPLTLVPLGEGIASRTDDDDGKSRMGGGFRTIKDAVDRLTEDQKVMYWKAVDDLRRRFNGRIAQLVGVQLRRDVKSVSRAVEGASSPDAALSMIAPVLAQNMGDWQKLYAQIYLTVGRAFAARVVEGFKGLPGVPEMKQDEGSEIVSLWDEAISAWAVENVENRITGIDFTTGQRIRRSLVEGASLGENLIELQDRVNLFGLPDVIANRSEVIARTEVISASNLGSRAGALSTGLPLRHLWITTRDSRTRGLDPKDKTDHWSMDGQAQPMNSPFIEPRTGEKLMFPGDTSLGAGAANVIQCRCTEGYEVIR